MGDLHAILDGDQNLTILCLCPIELLRHISFTLVGDDDFLEFMDITVLECRSQCNFGARTEHIDRAFALDGNARIHIRRLDRDLHRLLSDCSCRSCFAVSAVCLHVHGVGSGCQAFSCSKCEDVDILINIKLFFHICACSVCDRGDFINRAQSVEVLRGRRNDYRALRNIQVDAAGRLQRQGSLYRSLKRLDCHRFFNSVNTQVDLEGSCLTVIEAFRCVRCQASVFNRQCESGCSNEGIRVSCVGFGSLSFRNTADLHIVLCIDGRCDRPCCGRTVDSIRLQCQCRRLERHLRKDRCCTYADLQRIRHCPSLQLNAEADLCALLQFPVGIVRTEEVTNCAVFIDRNPVIGERLDAFKCSALNDDCFFIFNEAVQFNLGCADLRELLVYSQCQCLIGGICFSVNHNIDLGLVRSLDTLEHCFIGRDIFALRNDFKCAVIAYSQFEDVGSCTVFKFRTFDLRNCVFALTCRFTVRTIAHGVCGHVLEERQLYTNRSVIRREQICLRLGVDQTYTVVLQIITNVFLDDINTAACGIFRAGNSSYGSNSIRCSCLITCSDQTVCHTDDWSFIRCILAVYIAFNAPDYFNFAEFLDVFDCKLQ